MVTNTHPWEMDLPEKVTRSVKAHVEAWIPQLTGRIDRVSALQPEGDGPQHARSTKATNEVQDPGAAIPASLTEESRIDADIGTSQTEPAPDRHESLNGTSTPSSPEFTPTSSDTAPSRCGEPFLSLRAFTPPGIHSKFNTNSQHDFPDCTKPCNLANRNIINAYARAIDAKDDLIEILRKQNLASDHKCEDLELDSQKAAEELATCHEKLRDLGKKYDDLQEKYEAAQREMTLIQKKCAVLQETCATVQKDVRNLHQKWNGIEAKRERIGSLIADQKISTNNLPTSGCLAPISHTPDPEVFSGDRDAFEPWLSRLQFKIESNKMTAAAAVSYAISRTAGPPFEILMRYNPLSRADPFTLNDVVRILRLVYACEPEAKDGRLLYYCNGLRQYDNEKFDDFYRRWLFCVEALEHSELARIGGLKARLNGRLREALRGFFDGRRQTLREVVRLCRDLDASLSQADVR